jgi:hypothetical protein
MNLRFPYRGAPPCGRDASLLMKDVFFIRSLTPQQATGNALAVQFNHFQEFQVDIWKIQDYVKISVAMALLPVQMKLCSGTVKFGLLPRGSYELLLEKSI